MGDCCRYPCVYDVQFVFLGLLTLPIYIAIAPILFLSWCIQRIHLSIGSGCCSSRAADPHADDEEIMLGEDQIWASQNPNRWAVNNHPTIDCVLQMDAMQLPTLQRIVQERWTDKHPRFSRRMVQVGPRWVFRGYSGFSVAQHVRLLQHPSEVLDTSLDAPSNPPLRDVQEAPAEVDSTNGAGAAAIRVDCSGAAPDPDATHVWSRSELTAVMSHLASQPLHPDAAPWGIWLIPRVQTTEGTLAGGANDTVAPRSAVIFRINHAMVDGVGLVRLLLEELVDSPHTDTQGEADLPVEEPSLADAPPPITPRTPADTPCELEAEAEAGGAASYSAPAKTDSQSPADTTVRTVLPAPTQAAGRKLCLCDMLCRGLLLAVWEVLRVLLVCPNRSPLHGTQPFTGERTVAWSSATSVSDLKRMRRGIIAALAASASHEARRVTFNDVLMGLLGSTLRRHALGMRAGGVSSACTSQDDHETVGISALAAPCAAGEGDGADARNTTAAVDGQLAAADRDQDVSVSNVHAPEHPTPHICVKDASGGASAGVEAEQARGQHGKAAGTCASHCCVCGDSSSEEPLRSVRINIPVNLRPPTAELRMKNDFSLLLFDLPTGVGASASSTVSARDAGISAACSLLGLDGVQAILQTHKSMSAYKASGLAFAVMLAIKVTFATLPSALASWLVDFIAAKTSAVRVAYSPFAVVLLHSWRSACRL